MVPNNPLPSVGIMMSSVSIPKAGAEAVMRIIKLSRVLIVAFLPGIIIYKIIGVIASVTAAGLSE